VRDAIVLRSSGDFSFVQTVILSKISPTGNMVVLELLVYCLDVEVRQKKKKAQATLELLIKL